jgi:hypothetical protein
MAVAQKAMATEPTNRYANVAEFQEAIRTYFSHTESIALTERASEHLTQAKLSGSARDYDRALYALEEALRL